MYLSWSQNEKKESAMGKYWDRKFESWDSGSKLLREVSKTLICQRYEEWSNVVDMYIGKVRMAGNAVAVEV